MVKYVKRNSSRRFKNESVEDPHELLLSLVDLGSIKADEALLACVTEMSDAECKRVLNSLQLPECCDEDGVNDVVVPTEPAVTPLEDLDDMEDDDRLDGDDLEDDGDDDIEAVESRIRRLERALRRTKPSCQKESRKPVSLLRKKNEGLKSPLRRRK